MLKIPILLLIFLFSFIFLEKAYSNEIIHDRALRAALSFRKGTTAKKIPDGAELVMSERVLNKIQSIVNEHSIVIHTSYVDLNDSYEFYNPKTGRFAEEQMANISRHLNDYLNNFGFFGKFEVTIALTIKKGADVKKALTGYFKNGYIIMKPEGEDRFYSDGISEGEYKSRQRVLKSINQKLYAVSI